MALGGGRKTAVLHSDQGCQFTFSDFVDRLQTEGIKISWSGHKHCYYNILMERLWSKVKCEEVYLHGYRDDWQAKISLVRFFWRYCRIAMQGQTAPPGMKNSP
jgi:putative transposase